MIDDFGGGHQPILKKTKIISPLETSQTASKDMVDLKPETSKNTTEVQDEPAFQPPEKIASAKMAQPGLNSAAHTGLNDTTVAENPSAPARKLSFKSRTWPLNKKWTIISAAAVFVLLAGGITAAVVGNKSVKGSITVSKRQTRKVIAPPVVYSNLTGLPIADASINQRPVTGVMIENSIDARPQSGMNQAGVVFEAIAEGGITRFLTLYQDSQPDYLGPVRSARPYYVQWCMGFECSLGHVGGSPEALQDIISWGTKNLDQFYNAGTYQRITSRYAPHNVYTSTAQLNQLESGKGYGASNFVGFMRKTDKPYVAPTTIAATPSTTAKKSTAVPVVDERTPAAGIDFAISSNDFNAHFDYDVASNSYKRMQGGAAHMVLNKDDSQSQITPKVVVAMIMQYGLEADDHHSQYNVIGSGQTLIFQDGTVTTGTWNKTDTKTPLTLKDAAGNDIALNRGQTWLTALSGTNQVSYK